MTGASPRPLPPIQEQCDLRLFPPVSFTAEAPPSSDSGSNFAQFPPVRSHPFRLEHPDLETLSACKKESSPSSQPLTFSGPDTPLTNGIRAPPSLIMSEPVPSGGRRAEGQQPGAEERRETNDSFASEGDEPMRVITRPPPDGLGSRLKKQRDPYAVYTPEERKVRFNFEGGDSEAYPGRPECEDASTTRRRAAGLEKLRRLRQRSEAQRKKGNCRRGESDGEGASATLDDHDLAPSPVALWDLQGYWYTSRSKLVAVVGNLAHFPATRDTVELEHALGFIWLRDVEMKANSTPDNIYWEDDEHWTRVNPEKDEWKKVERGKRSTPKRQSGKYLALNHSEPPECQDDEQMVCVNHTEAKSGVRSESNLNVDGDDEDVALSSESSSSAPEARRIHVGLHPSLDFVKRVCKETPGLPKWYSRRGKLCGKIGWIDGVDEIDGTVLVRFSMNTAYWFPPAVIIPLTREQYKDAQLHGFSMTSTTTNSHASSKRHLAARHRARLVVAAFMAVAFLTLFFIIFFAAIHPAK